MWTSPDPDENTGFWGVSSDSTADINAARDYAEKAAQSASDASGSATLAEQHKDASEASAVRAETAANNAEDSEEQTKVYRDEVEEFYRLIRDGAVDMGTWDATTNAYPTRPDVNSYWFVRLPDGVPSHSFDGKTWTTGDRLLYSLVSDSFIHVDTDSRVISVNGKQGVVNLVANDVGAYTKVEVDTNLDLKADKTDTYTKTEVDAKVTDSIKVSSVNTKTGAVVLSAADVNALPLTGGRLSGTIRRTDYSNGCLVGLHQAGFDSRTRTNPIHVLGNDFRPTNDALVNMHGIGYTNQVASFIPSTLKNLGTDGWGMYVAAGSGQASIFLNGSQGQIETTGSISSGNDVFATDGSARVSLIALSKRLAATEALEAEVAKLKTQLRSITATMHRWTESNASVPKTLN